MKFIDLSLPINSEMPVTPGDVNTTIGKVTHVEKAGWTLSNIQMSLHAGAHVESPAHAIKGGRTLDSYPLDTFTGEAQCITREQIGKVAVDKEILLIYTGSDKFWPKPEYSLQGLNLSTREAQWLAEQKLKVVGSDIVSVGSLEVHHIIFNSGSLIMEGLSNLETVLSQRFRLYFFPLKLSQEASPVRLVAELIK